MQNPITQPSHASVDPAAETASLRKRSTRMRALLISSALVGIGAINGSTIFGTPAFADGGIGGSNGSITGGAGGSGYTGNAGQAGADGGAAFGAGGGGGGAGGGAGGNGGGGSNGADVGGLGGAGGTVGHIDGFDGAVASGGAGGGGGGYNGNGGGAASLTGAANLLGGNGGVGGGNTNNAVSGGGGAGGFGAVITGGSGTSSVYAGNVQAGQGGTGGQSRTRPGFGGDGGIGVFLTGSGASFDLTSGGSIAGGSGGAGAATLYGDGANGANGGAGISGSNLSIMNSGTITGGAGGTGGESSNGFGNGGNGGNGADGIRGSSLSVVNAGSIVGGAAGAGGSDGFGGFGTSGTAGNTITFTGGVNSLTLWSTSAITGNVVAVSGGTDTLALGGASNGTFDVSQIGAAAQYRNFANYQKTGAGTWTLTGTTGAATPWTLAQGTLAISSDANLGGATGALTFTGGTLQTTAGFSSARNIALGTGGGTLQVETGTLALSGIISDSGGTPGGLTKTGTGTLSLTSTGNTYSGVTSVLAGTLAAGAAFSFSGVSSHAIATGATLDIGGEFQAIGSLTGAGTVTNNGIGAARLTTGNDNSNATFAGVIKDGTAALQFEIDGLAGSTTTLTGASTYSGGTIICNCAALQIGNGGTTGSISGDVLNDGRLIFNRSDSYTFAGVISGAGDVTKAGTGNTSLTGINTYTGATAVNAGTLSVNGSTAASALTTVNAGGALGGNGTVGNVVINGGVLAPGNSIGALNVAGNLAFTSASNYMVEVSPSKADRVNVTGTATLGGATVNAVFATGSYVSTQYTIVNAAGGVIGTFGRQVNTNLPANFTSSLAYDSGNVYLKLALNFVPPDPTPTPVPGYNAFSANQQGVANTLVNYFNRTGGIPLAFGALDAAGLTAASGETATGSQQTAFDAMNMFMGLMTDPFAAGRLDAAPRAAPDGDEALNYAAKRRPSDALAAIYRKAPPTAPAFAARWNVWAAGFGGSQSTDGNAATGSGGASSRIYGSAVGADYWMSPNTVAGFALAGGGTNFTVAGGGTGRSDLFQAGGFVRHTAASAYLTASAAYGWQDITTDRNFGGSGLQGRFTAHSYSGRIEGGNRFVMPWPGGVGVTPYAAAQVTAFEMPAYAESAVGGVGTFALNYDGRTVTATRSEIGLRSDKSFAINDAMLTLRGRAAWAHDYTTARSVSATFQALPGTSFVVNGARPASDAALTTAAAELSFVNGITLGATFEGEFSDVTRSYAGKGVVRYAW